MIFQGLKLLLKLGLPEYFFCWKLSFGVGSVASRDTEASITKRFQWTGRSQNHDSSRGDELIFVREWESAVILVTDSFCQLLFVLYLLSWHFTGDRCIIYTHTHPRERETKSSQGDTNPLEEIRNWKDTKQVLIPSLGKVIRFERDEGKSARVSEIFLWHSSLILMSHHATLAHFKTHLKQLSRWEQTLCSCALGGRHSQHLPVVWSSVVLAPQCNFQNILGFVLWHHRSSAAVDSLKCRQVVVYIFQLSVSLVSLVSAMEKVSKRQKDLRDGREALLSPACSWNYWATKTLLLYMVDCQVAFLDSQTLT